MNKQTCPLQNGPAPMPMVGIFNADVAAAATGAGTHSNTTEKHPASCKASAVSTTYTSTIAWIVLLKPITNQSAHQWRTNKYIARPQAMRSSTPLQHCQPSSLHPLRPKSTEHTNSLRREANMPHDSNSSLHNSLSCSDPRWRTPFQLDCIHSTFLQHPHS